MFDIIKNFFNRFKKKEVAQLNSGDAAKERLHLVLMQDRANVSADYIDLMKQDIIDDIKKYIDIDEKEIDVRLTNQIRNDGSNGMPALYANIPIKSVNNITDNTKKNANNISNSININADFFDHITSKETAKKTVSKETAIKATKKELSDKDATTKTTTRKSTVKTAVKATGKLVSEDNIAVVSKKSGAAIKATIDTLNNSKEPSKKRATKKDDSDDTDTEKKKAVKSTSASKTTKLVSEEKSASVKRATSTKTTEKKSTTRSTRATKM